MKRSTKANFIVFIIISGFANLTAQDWLPLQVGNQWQYLSSRLDEHIYYQHQSYNLIYSRVDTDTTINDTTYFYLYSLLRYDVAQEKIFIRCDSSEYLHMDFNLPVDTIVLLYTPYCYFYDTYVISANKTFNDSSIYCKGINWFYPGLFELNEFWYFARGLGLFSTTEYGHANGGIDWETDDKLIQANINGVNYSEDYYPEIEIDTVSAVSDSVFSLTFPVQHQYNRVYSDTLYYTNLNFIDTVKMFSFYKNGNTIIENPVVYAYNTSSASENWEINTILNIDMMMNGYIFNYRIEAIDKGLVPHISFSPDTGYYEAKYDTTSDVKNVHKSIGNFEIFQNYPNPFNPATEIKYTVGSSGKSYGNTGRVSVTVYDVLGNKVAELVNEEKSPGTYSVEFDASRLSSGVYFYRMKAGSFTQTRKMILLR